MVLITPYMDCFTETLASIWIVSLRALGTNPPQDEDDCSVQENLELCRSTLERREADLTETCERLGREALNKRNDPAAAKGKLLERRRAMKRLDKLRSSLSLVDAQLDALRSTELDRELMRTLLASSTALKKAGVGKGVQEAEAIMSELDEHMRESTEITSVLSTPLLDGDLNATFDMDSEFEELQKDLELQRALIPSPRAEIASTPMRSQDYAFTQPAAVPC
jgi:hypothetical protein